MELLLFSLAALGCWALGFLSGLTYAEANLEGRVRDVRKAQGRRWWQ